jgi:hypothetical protein
MNINDLNQTLANEQVPKHGGTITLAASENSVVITRCPFCGVTQKVVAPTAGLNAWRGGELIQKALPSLTADEREALMTGICNSCFPS